MLKKGVGRSLLSRLRNRLNFKNRIGRLYAIPPDRKVAARDLLSIIVPIHNARADHLSKLLKSFKSNRCPATDLILVDDGSTSRQTTTWLARHQADTGITILQRAENGGISAAINTGLAQARGTWVTFLDHDDMIAPNALTLICNTLTDFPDIELLYTDEVIIDDKDRIIGHFFKPAFDPVLLSGMNYINHFTIMRRARLKQVGPLNPDFDGSQDYEILLRYLDGLTDRDIKHLPYPAYWWRTNENTYSRRHLDRALGNARRALAQHMKAPGFQTRAIPADHPELHRIAFRPQDSAWPRIGIVIPNKDSPDLIAGILQDVFTRTDYPDVCVVVVDGASENPKTLEIYEDYTARFRNFSVKVRPGPFNFSAAINLGMADLDVDHFLLLNNDIRTTHEDWLQEMVSCLAYQDTGIVGAKLLFPDDTLQHAGLIVGQGGLAGHWHYRLPADSPGPMGRLRVRNSMLAVTGAVMLISKDCVRATGPWDETNFAVAFNDVDYCLRAHGLGFRTIWTPFACLYHQGSASRGELEKTPREIARFDVEKANLTSIHKTADRIDPASSPFFSRHSSGAQIALPKALPKARGWFE